MEKGDEADRLAGSGGRRTLLSHSHRYCRSLLTGVPPRWACRGETAQPNAMLLYLLHLSCYLIFFSNLRIFQVYFLRFKLYFFSKFSYIFFAMYLNIHISRCIVKIIYLNLPNRPTIWNRWSIRKIWHHESEQF